jgi:hydroxybutyrate-dimer hydrolase
MRARSLLCVIALALGASAVQATEDERPSFIRGPILHQFYDPADPNNPDDLLTAGLGAAGLQSAAATGFADPLKPTPRELRRRAIHQNYRALVDVAANGGYGTLYGPTVGPNGTTLPNDGKIAGDEYLAYASDGFDRENVTMLVQVPVTFDSRKPCIVAAPSSGSRGVYGAIGTAGEWGLKRGCAVAYTDKGTGNGAHDLQNDTVNLIDGTRASAAGAADESHFTAKLSPGALAAFNAATPNRFAFKHAHSQLNPEREWGQDVLNAIQFAFFVLNDVHNHDRDRKHRHDRPAIRRDNTIVIASSVSNGGGASLAAAELDRHGWIDGVAVSEPQVQLVPDRKLRIVRGDRAIEGFGKTLYDYFTIANLYQPCAALANPTSPGLAFITSLNRAANRCASLRAKGLLAMDGLVAQAAESLAILRDAGWEAESNLLHASHYAFAVPPVTISYANAYGRFSVTRNTCGFSFASTDAAGAPVAAAPANVAKIFGDGNGVPPTGGINIVNNLSVGGPRLDGISVSPSTGLLDLNVDGALCLRRLQTARDMLTDEILDGDDRLDAIRVRLGVAQTLRNADLNGKPAIIVHGRADTLVPVNHTSRPYYGTNKLGERWRSRLHYYEVTNAQHFDAFIDNAALPGYDSMLVPLHYYFFQAMDLMYAHLRDGAPLPASQVVRTTPRGGTPGAAPAITTANVPSIAATPNGNDLIQFSNGTLRIPD